MSWTDDRVSLLKKLWGEGKTAAEIAKELGGVTRNAVIGKAHRLKLSNRISPIQQNNKKPVKAAEDKPVQKIVSVVNKAIRHPVNIKGVQLSELKERMCRWPIGDPRDADFKFCGCDSAVGLPYCDDHAKAAYQTVSRNRVIKAEDVENYGKNNSDDKEIATA